MNRLNPLKLSIEYKNGITPFGPPIPRKYTLTHSDITADLYLTIGSDYACNKITSMRDEVLGEWIVKNNHYLFYITVQIDHPLGKQDIRNRIFIKELPLAIEAIRYGDRSLFNYYPALDQSFIYIHFNSSEPKYNRVECWGVFKDYI